MKLLTCVVVATAFCSISALDCWKCRGEEDCQDPAKEPSCSGSCLYATWEEDDGIIMDCLGEEEKPDEHCAMIREYVNVLECITCKEDLCNDGSEQSSEQSDESC